MRAALAVGWLAALVVLAACRGARPAIDSAALDRTLHVVRTLSSEEFGGRYAGSDGGRRTREFLIAEFERIGLEPMPGGFEHPISVPNPAPRGFTAATRVVGPAGEARLGIDAVPFRFSGEGAARGPLVFVGHGLEDARLGLDDYAGRDVEGRIVVALRGAPGWREPGSPLRGAYADDVAFVRKVRQAAAHGAVGFVLVDDLVSGPAPLRAAQHARGDPCPIPAVWCSREFVGPWFAHGWIGAPVDARAELELVVGLEREPPALETANLIGVLRGRCEAEPVVVAGAHFDHLGRVGPLLEVHPGADDNASGVAVLLAVAERLARGPRLERTVWFVAFAAEELELAGSRAWLHEGPLPHAGIAAMLNFEMVGRVGSRPLRVDGVGSAAGWRSVLERSDLPAGVASRDHVDPRSDHWAFLLRGIPALVLTGPLHDDYHSPRDTFARIEPEGLARAAEIGVRIVSEVARRSTVLEFDPRVLRPSHLGRPR